MTSWIPLGLISILFGNILLVKEITCALACLVGASWATDLKLLRDGVRVCFFQMVLDDIGHSVNKHWIGVQRLGSSQTCDTCLFDTSE